MMGCIQAEPPQGSSAQLSGHPKFCLVNLLFLCHSIRTFTDLHSQTRKFLSVKDVVQNGCVCAGFFFFFYLVSLRCQKLVFTECPAFR